jgi:hypothetical protein
MGQFSVEKPVLPGSTLSGNQQSKRIGATKPRACDSDSHAMASRLLHTKMIAMRVMLTTD